LQRALLAARIQDALIFIEGIDSVQVESSAGVQVSIRNLLAGISHGCILSCQGTDVPQTGPCIQVKLPGLEERSALWRSGLEQGGVQSDQSDMEDVAGAFLLGTDQIKEAAADCASRQHTDGEKAVPRRHLFDSARRQLISRLPRSVQTIEPSAHWSDLILTSDVTAQLRDICIFVRERPIVLNHWRFGRSSARGRSINILLSGASGTGKTTACEIIAAELGRTLLKIDMAQTISKYIGESEKQLAAAFDTAERSGALLMFDEADALFGKRTTVSDSHDRYANIQVSYLLQRIEEFQGILILTSNLQPNIDPAFMRRMQFVVELHFPDEDQREKIWRVTVPPEAPLGDDIDFKELANRYSVTGGNIKNIAIAAAMLASSESEAIAMRHIVYAARREYQKIGKAFPHSDFLAYAQS
jgi:SpoVK/Ycf46/Vps4 family AAA+-type ATPase